MIWFMILGIIIGIVVVLILVAPKAYHVYREIEINRKKSEVFEYLQYVKN